MTMMMMIFVGLCCSLSLSACSGAVVHILLGHFYTLPSFLYHFEHFKLHVLLWLFVLFSYFFSFYSFFISPSKITWNMFQRSLQIINFPNEHRAYFIAFKMFNIWFIICVNSNRRTQFYSLLFGPCSSNEILIFVWEYVIKDLMKCYFLHINHC